ncbi:TNT domain-containing protein [Nocardiopsis sp. NRRL B-16309]|uniref:TNT domain-containing protein n=1 Tax=Nocardiopsis sp. NRRL B-16309 TaxID=1519494 RepID=UPI0006AEBF85|nr:TNT domain-containing protein [Nocardiopsis sp. NRRL B-16309]
MKPTTVAAAALALLVLAPPAHAHAAASAPPSPTPPSPVPALAGEPMEECPLLDPPPTAEERAEYVCGDPRLGPADLPEEGPVARLVEGYEPFGGLWPVEFLDEWYLEDQVDPDTGQTWSGWNYPEHDGFVVVDGEPVNELRALEPGTMLDRFGSPRGTFLAPAGAPFAERALPPDSLNTWPGGAEHNYNCYEVLTGVTALVGPIAPHFEQPGGGEQLLVPADELPEADGEGYVPVAELLDRGYLDQRPAEECVPPKGYDLAS